MRSGGRRIARWRASGLSRTCGSVVAGGFVLVGLDELAGGGASHAAFGAVLIGLAAVAWVLVRGSIDLYADRVVLGGVLRRSREIPLADLIAVEPGRSSLHFRTGSARVDGPIAVGERRPRLRDHRMRGDRIAAVIMAQAELVRHTSS